MKTRTLILLFAAAALSACNSSPDAETAPSDTDGVEAPSDLAGPATDETDGAAAETEPINLTPLNDMQIGSAALQGELGCSFVRDGETHSILVAKADVVPDGDILGVIALSGQPERIANVNAGGFSDMDGGVSLASGNMTVAVEATGTDESQLENSVRTATLTAKRADGETRVYEGKWTCGP